MAEYIYNILTTAGVKSMPTKQRIQRVFYLENFYAWGDTPESNKDETACRELTVTRSWTNTVQVKTLLEHLPRAANYCRTSDNVRLNLTNVRAKITKK